MNGTQNGRSGRPLQRAFASKYRSGSQRLSGLLAISCLFGATVTGAPAAADSLRGKGDQFLSQSVVKSARGWARVIIRLDGEISTSRQKTLDKLGVDV